MKNLFTVADVNNIISALTCYCVADFDYEKAMKDIEHTVRGDRDVLEHISYCMDIIKNNI